VGVRVDHPGVALTRLHERAQVIRATAAKVDTLETQVLQRVDNGTAGVMEVEAVLEFLAQALEAMDSVDTKGDDQVSSLRRAGVCACRRSAIASVLVRLSAFP
jgi:hypothetical protein